MPCPQVCNLERNSNEKKSYLTLFDDGTLLSSIEDIRSHTKLIEKHVDLVDDTPHAGILYGGDPDNDFLAPILKYALFGNFR